MSGLLLPLPLWPHVDLLLIVTVVLRKSNATGLRRRIDRPFFPPPCFAEDGPDSVERFFVASSCAAFNRASRALFLSLACVVIDSTTQRKFTQMSRPRKDAPQS